MSRINRIGLVATLAAGLSIAAFAAKGHADMGKGPTAQQRKEFQEKRAEFMEKRIAKLPTEEQKLARTLGPLRDSLMRTIGDYHRKVKNGAAARSLTAERAKIVSLEGQIQRMQADNQEVWLDLLADLPGPRGPRGPEGKSYQGDHHRRDGKNGPDCPRRDMKDCPRHDEDDAPPPGIQ